MALPKIGTPVTVSLGDLQSNNVPFQTLLDAFGPDSLGILVVRDLPPSFSSLRSSVLAASSHLANLPTSQLDQLTNPSAKYLVGWSHGKESLRPGVVDTLKGSYYINCAFYQDPSKDGPDDEDRRWNDFPEYMAPNIWPPIEILPSFRADIEALIRLIIDVATLVARACDKYAESTIDGYRAGYMEKMVQESQVTKARLLHYFPASKNTQETDEKSSDIDDQAPSEADSNSDDWCATHLDHGCLTGLTSAMFVDEASNPPSDPSIPLRELPKPPSPSSGLYIRSRQNEVYKVNIPRDCLAFQTGEVLELITEGKFKAVPHFVRGAGSKSSAGLARNTLAVFTQPNLDELVDFARGVTFGEFAREVVGRNTAG